MSPETDRQAQERAPPSRRWLCALLALVVPALAGYTIAHQWRTPMLGFYRDTSDPPVVSLVMGGGPAEAAGLRAGDAILAVNGAPFDTGYDRRLGQTYRMEIVRDGRSLTLAMATASMSQVNRRPLFSAVFVALTFWCTGTLLVWRHLGQQDVRLLFLLFQTVGVALLYGLAYPRFLLPPPWMVSLGFACFHLAAALFLHYHLTFPVVLGTTRQRRWALGLLYGLTLVATADSLTRTEPWTSPLAYTPVLVSMVALGVVVYVYVRRASADGRRRLRVVVAGSVLGLAPPLLGYVLPTVIQGYSPDIPRWLVSLFLVIVPLSYLYATVRHNLFGIDRLLNRTLVYAFLSVGIFALYAGPFLLLYRFLPDDVLLQTTTVTGLTLLVGLTFDWGRTRVQRLVDRLFYGGWYDYPGVVETVSAALSHTLEREQLSAVLTQQVPELMQLHRGHLAIGEPDPYLPVQPPTSSLQLPLSFEGQARGVWTVGQRRDGEAFTAADRRILQTLARQAEIAFSNVLLVETLRRQLDEIRATQRQLLRSREAERARLARELHDSPIQALVGMNLQLGFLLAAGQEGMSAVEALKDLRAEVRELLAELRKVCAALRPPMLDALGLGAALRALADDWSAQQGVAVRLDLAPDDTLRPEPRGESIGMPVEGPRPEPFDFAQDAPVEGLRRLPGEVAINLYRVVQEALANVAHHANARLVTIRLAWEDSGLILSVQDDGRGFVVPYAFDELAAGGHFGLVGMQERAELIGGAWAVESAPGQGTTVRVVWDRRGQGDKGTRRPGDRETLN